MLLAAARARAAVGAREPADLDAKCVASADVIVRGEVGIGEEKDAWAGGSQILAGRRLRRAGEQAADLHFEARGARGEAGVARARAQLLGTRAHPAAFLWRIG